MVWLRAFRQCRGVRGGDRHSRRRSRRAGPPNRPRTVRCSAPRPEDEHLAARPRSQARDHASPGVGENVAGRDYPYGVDPGGDRYEHVVGEGNPQQVRDHATPRAAGGPEAERRQGRGTGGGAFRGEPEPAFAAVAARDGPGHHDHIAASQGGDALAHLDHLGGALVPDAERSLERDRPADAAHDRIDQLGPHPELHRPGHTPMDRQGVAVTSARYERAHDGVSRIARHRRGPLPPLQMPGPNELQLTHSRAAPARVLPIP